MPTKRKPARRKTAARPRRNPDGLTDEAVRYHVSREASTAGGHYAMAIVHRHKSQQAWASGRFDLAEQEERMSMAHLNVSHALAALQRATAHRKHR